MCFGVGCNRTAVGTVADKVADTVGTAAADSIAADKAAVDNTADILAADNNTDFPD